MKAGWAVIAVIAALGLPAPAQATTIDLASAPGSVRVDGQAANDHAGLTVASAGDLNGDGRADLIVGAPGADNNGRTDSGSAYVIYGGQNLASIDLQNLGAAGFRIDGAAAGDQAGSSVAAAGDLNGDGHPDAIVGAPFAGNNGRGNSGSAYVIYGQAAADPADVDLANLGARGMQIDGAAGGDTAGTSVAAAGDLNGDGQPDAIIGAPFAGNNSRIQSGSAYVVYGQAAADPPDVDLATITTTQASRGMRIDGAAAFDEAGISVVGGDVNGDGHPDPVIGAPSADNNARADSGSAYVLDLAAPETTIDSGPTLTNDTTPTFAFHASEAASFGCSIDPGTPAFGPCSGPGATHTPTLPLGDGAYTFRVRATDPSANTDPTPATQDFTVDTTAPQTKIATRPPKKLKLKGRRKRVKVKFVFTSTEAASSFDCKLDKQTSKPCRSPKTYKLKKGKHTFAVAATDKAGNADTSAARFKLKVKPAKKHRRRHHSARR